VAQSEVPEFKTPVLEKKKKEPGVWCQAPVAHACNPSYLEDRDQKEESQFEASLVKLFKRPYLENT
jgi:hypothetical protein